MATDPVCKMTVDPTGAAAKSEHGGQTYYFCCKSCQTTFNADPEKYLRGAASGAHVPDTMHRHGQH